MTNIPVPQAKYALLDKDNKRLSIWNIRSRFMFSLITLITLLTFFGCLYFVLTTFFKKPTASGQHPVLVKDVPYTWLYRALAYNEIDTNAMNRTDPTPVKNGRPKQIKDFKLVCYYTFPSPNNKTSSSWYLDESNIDPNLCTHILVGFANVVNNSIFLEDYQLESAKNVIKLKEKNKKLKVMLSIGGAGDSPGFEHMVLNHANRKMFIKSIDYFVKKIGFDGIDLDWEFPNREQNGDKHQRIHFTQLLHEIRNEINRQEDEKKYLLSVAVAAPQFIIDESYDIIYMNDNVDFINLMSYDYHFYTKFTPFTGLNSPLFSRSVDFGYMSTLNINYSASYWFSKGMDKSKIVIGLATFGHSFTLFNVDNNGLEAPAKGYGSLGTNGFIDYADVCWFLEKYNVKPIFDQESKSPYAFHFHDWISFDNEQSLAYKAEFIKNQNYGGAMVLSLNTDDHNGSCKPKHYDGGRAVNVTFPLTRKVKSILDDEQL